MTNRADIHLHKTLSYVTVTYYSVMSRWMTHCFWSSYQDEVLSLGHAHVSHIGHINHDAWVHFVLGITDMTAWIRHISILNESMNLHLSSKSPRVPWVTRSEIKWVRTDGQNWSVDDIKGRGHELVESGWWQEEGVWTMEQTDYRRGGGYGQWNQTDNRRRGYGQWNPADDRRRGGGMDNGIRLMTGGGDMDSGIRLMTGRGMDNGTQTYVRMVERYWRWNRPFSVARIVQLWTFYLEITLVNVI